VPELVRDREPAATGWAIAADEDLAAQAAEVEQVALAVEIGLSHPKTRPERDDGIQIDGYRVGSGALDHVRSHLLHGRE
jgi:hypothetical protein